MTTKKKLLIAAIGVIAVSSTVGYSIVARNRGVVAVQAGRVVRQDLTQTVSANGEIKPKKYVNVSSNMMGRIVRLPVKEGDDADCGNKNFFLRCHLASIRDSTRISFKKTSYDTRRIWE